MSESYKVYASQEYVDNKLNDVSGLPAGSKPNQYIVTDKDGNAKWEDKLCWSESIKEVVLAECQREFLVNDFGERTFDIDGALFADGETYTVKWNGVDYVCVAMGQDAPPGVIAPAFVGNFDKVNGSGDTGEPFAAFSDPINNRTSFLTFDDATSCTVSVVHHTTTMHKISGKLIEGMGWSETDVTVIAVDQEVTQGGVLGTSTYFTTTELNPDVYFAMESPFVVGKTYTVTLNGTEYNDLVAYEDNRGHVCIGATVDELASGTYKLPFGIGYNSETYEPYQYGVEWVQSMGETVTISISEVAETIHPVDKKYLPSDNLRVFITMDENDEYVSSHTYEEIKSHVLSGGTCDCVMGRYIMHLSEATFMSDVQPFDLVVQAVFTSIDSGYVVNRVGIAESGAVFIGQVQLSYENDA